MSKESKVLGYSGIALYPTEAQKLQLNKILAVSGMSTTA